MSQTKLGRSVRRSVRHYFANRAHPTPQQVSFWLRELRTPELLISTTANAADAAVHESKTRPLLRHALKADNNVLTQSIYEEEIECRKVELEYWAPLKAELEQLRRQRLN